MHNLPLGLESVYAATRGRGQRHKAEPVENIFLVKEFRLVLQENAWVSAKDIKPLRRRDRIPQPVLGLFDQD